MPLLVVGTARPELLERRPGWGGGKRERDHALALAALRRRHGAAVDALLEQPPCSPAGAAADLLARAGGNPLYAEQFARMLGRARATATELPLPESVQGIIAARLDALCRRGEDACSRTPP